MTLDPNRTGQGGRSEQEVWPKWMWFAVPVLVIFVVAGLWWAIFAPTEPRHKSPTLTPTPRAIVPLPQPTGSITPGVGITSTFQVQPTIAPATATPTAPPTATVEPTLEQVTFAIGDKAVVSGTDQAGLRMRAGAGTGHAQVKLLPENSVLEIIGGPKEANGYTWWQVRDQTGTTGWVAGDFLRRQE